MIRKLLLIRIAKARADLLAESGFAHFVKGEPLNVSPAAWDEQSGLSHYGYVLEGLKLKDLDNLRKWLDKNTEATLLEVIQEVGKNRLPDDFEGDTVDYALSQVGLKINSLAE